MGAQMGEKSLIAAHQINKKKLGWFFCCDAGS